MPEPHHLLAFVLVALAMVMTPGPNMIYLVSRSISQGPMAGLVSLAGVALGFVVYMLSAVFGLTVLLLAVPYAYDTIRILGALYLVYLAWNALKPGERAVFAVKELPRDSKRKLFMMGLMTNLLNPKTAVLYLSLLPQFVDPARGHVLSQSLVLGFSQIAVSLTVNALIVIAAGRIALFLAKRPFWSAIQRYLMGTVLLGLVSRMLFEARR
ncbi:LysE family translocator [Martelella limonii]|uniref:LysE family translocator n=1 Tax=Martelella limonii TaxID=1647649 RepID=UPI0015809067|nr:LysE family translocator [Martelella limonii]